ncbi:anthranilate synthase component II [Aureimonas ureilytica]|uniref:anthranilate synthase component II n=1 Tax=Aureimonas ureilytica TaxID=401562 RepID=UPI003CF0AFAE
MILLLDNYDSFSANLARYLERLGLPVAIRRSDRVTLGEIEAMAPEAIVLSPGPCGPAEAGVCLDTVRAFSGRIPILGVCLGHQVIGAAFGGWVGPALRPMHGLSSPVRHEGGDLFEGLPQPLEVGRYHSLIVRETPEMDAALRVTAWSDEGEIMALRHRTHPTFGIQFHPESVLTPEGTQLLGNFRTLLGRKRVESP